MTVEEMKAHAERWADCASREQTCNADSLWLRHYDQQSTAYSLAAAICERLDRIVVALEAQQVQMSRPDDWPLGIAWPPKSATGEE